MNYLQLKLAQMRECGRQRKALGGAQGAQPKGWRVMKFTEPATAGGSSSLLEVSFSFALSPGAAARIRGLDGSCGDAFLGFR